MGAIVSLLEHRQTTPIQSNNQSETTSVSGPSSCPQHRHPTHLHALRTFLFLLLAHLPYRLLISFATRKSLRTPASVPYPHILHRSFYTAHFSPDDDPPRIHLVLHHIQNSSYMSLHPQLHHLRLLQSITQKRQRLHRRRRRVP